MPIDVFSYGSDAKLLKDIEDLVGEPIFDNFSLGSQTRMLAQIKEATGVELDPVAFSVGNLVAAIEATITDGGGGGEGWLLSGGVWNDEGVWDDGAAWEDAA